MPHRHGSAVRRAHHHPIWLLAAVAVLIAVLAIVNAAAAQAPTKKFKLALGDIATIESLNLLIALDRAKQRGVDVEVIQFKSEDIATQAVLNGQADLGQGTPYAVIQKVNAPVRMFFLMQTLQFFPVVDQATYKSWKDLDGQEMVVHSRGSGTEAMANVMAQQQGIKYKSISYVPGSEVRALAMLKGNIKATFVDLSNRNLLMREAPGKFIVLPMGEVKASDEALFARKDVLDANKDAIGVLVEEMLTVWRNINKDPNFVVAERKRLNLLRDLPPKLEEEVLPYYKQGVENGIFPNDGGGEKAAQNDILFFTTSGALKGAPAELKAEDFWYFDPLKRALAKAGS
jgi:NitT/TauT family transport system substrate-binding protein